MWVRGLGAACLVAVGATACTTTATVTRRNGAPVEGWIRGGTSDGIIVDRRIGEREEIPRSDVVDIDHPGNVHVIVGGIVLGFGSLLVAGGIDNCTGGADPTGDCASLFIPALAGAGMAAWGLSQWLGSKDAVDDRSLAHHPPKKPDGRAGKRPGANERPPEANEPAPPPAELPPLVQPPAVLPPLQPRAPAPPPSGSATPPPAPGPDAPETPSPNAPEPPEKPPGVTW